MNWWWLPNQVVFMNHGANRVSFTTKEFLSRKEKNLEETRQVINIIVILFIDFCCFSTNHN